MIELYSAPQNLFFSLALTLMFLIGLTQIISVTFGLGLDGVLDDLLPDFDADIDVDLDADAGAHADMGMMGGIMGWLHIGKVPLLISLSFFLLIFAFIGYGAQIFCYNLGIGFLSGWAAAPAVFFVCLPLVRIGNQVLAKIYPQDETLAVSRDTFVGKIASITIGKVTHEKSAEAKLIDDLGKTHYVMVLADEEAGHFEKGNRVLIVGKRGSRFTAVADPFPNSED